MKAPSLTLGIEEEYQIIDPETRALRSYITEMLQGDHVTLGEVKPELHQSMVEIGTKVCRTPAEARSELVRLRGLVMGLAAKNGLVIAAAGTHPVLTSAPSIDSYSFHDRNVGGVPVRGKFLNTTLRYDFRPVLRPIQKGELVDKVSTCGTK